MFHCNMQWIFQKKYLLDKGTDDVWLIHVYLMEFSTLIISILKVLGAIFHFY